MHLQCSFTLAICIDTFNTYFYTCFSCNLIFFDNQRMNIGNEATGLAVSCKGMADLGDKNQFKFIIISFPTMKYPQNTKRGGCIGLQKSIQEPHWQELPHHKKEKNSYESEINRWIIGLKPNYRRYLKRTDMLKTHKQKLLAICYLRDKLSEVKWKLCLQQLTKFLTQRQMNNLELTQMSRKYMEKYHLAAIWAIDKYQIEEMIRVFNPINKNSKKVLTKKDFLAYIIRFRHKQMENKAVIK